MGPFLYKYRNDDIDFSILSHIIKNDHSSFRYVPEKFQERILDLLDSSFFTKQNLNNLHNVTLPGKLYNTYFGHIQLYRIFQWPHSERIVWDIEDHHGPVSKGRFVDNCIITIRGNHLEVIETPKISFEYETRC
jgi:hypothetical protein